MKWVIIIISIAALIAMIVATWVYTRKNRYVKEQFDERQAYIRGRAYQYAFWTVSLCSIAYFVLTAVSGRRFAEDGVSALIIACIGVAVFAIYSVFKDSFFGVKGKQVGTGRPAAYVGLLAVVIVSQGLGAVRTIREHGIVSDGILTWRCGQLVLAVLFLLILIAIGIRYFMNRREELGERR